MADRVKTIFDYAKKRFGTVPEYLWENYPDYAVLRNRFNKKWYALVANVQRENLGLGDTGSVWILNVKCDPMMIGSLIDREGFLPAYHMNKEHWVSVLVDDLNISVEEILDILDMSYEIVSKPNSKRKNRTN